MLKDGGLKYKKVADKLRKALDGANRDDLLMSGGLAAVPSGNEFMSMAHQRFASGNRTEIAGIWEKNSEQVSVYIAMMRGAFTPF